MRCLRGGQLKEAWSRLPSADKFYLPILAANVLVFALWRIPALGPTLTKLFTANAFGRKQQISLNYAIEIIVHNLELSFDHPLCLRRGSVSIDAFVHIQPLFLLPHIRQHVCAA